MQCLQVFAEGLDDLSTVRGTMTGNIVFQLETKRLVTGSDIASERRIVHTDYTGIEDIVTRYQECFHKEA